MKIKKSKKLTTSHCIYWKFVTETSPATRPRELSMQISKKKKKKEKKKKAGQRNRRNIATGINYHLVRG